MEKAVIIDAYHRGLLSREECTKLLGIDPSILTESDNSELKKIFNLESYIR